MKRREEDEPGRDAITAQRGSAGPSARGSLQRRGLLHLAQQPARQSQSAGKVALLNAACSQSRTALAQRSTRLIHKHSSHFPPPISNQLRAITGTGSPPFLSHYQVLSSSSLSSRSSCRVARDDPEGHSKAWTRTVSAPHSSLVRGWRALSQVASASASASWPLLSCRRHLRPIGQTSLFHAQVGGVADQVRQAAQGSSLSLPLLISALLCSWSHLCALGRGDVFLDIPPFSRGSSPSW